jgi:hypothetical protein
MNESELREGVLEILVKCMHGAIGQMAAVDSLIAYIREHEAKEVERLTEEELAALNSYSEVLWYELRDNHLGGYSGVNRPFYLAWKIREAIERFGHRNTGLNTPNEQPK